MSFKGFDPKDGTPLYDSLESAIERAKQLCTWDNNPDAKIFIPRLWVPTRIRHFFQNTWFDWICYKELKENAKTSNQTRPR